MFTVSDGTFADARRLLPAVSYDGLAQMSQQSVKNGFGQGVGMTDSLVLRGKRFDLTLYEERRAIAGGSWQWMLAAPGELVLSGEAPSADQAIRSAQRAGRLWARLTPLP
jgi:hypothetical protein